MPVDSVSTASTATVNPSVDLSSGVDEDRDPNLSQPSTLPFSVGSIFASVFPVVAPFAGVIDWVAKHVFGFFKRVSG